MSIHKGSKVRLLDNVYYHDSKEERFFPGTEGVVTEFVNGVDNVYVTVHLNSYDTPLVFIPEELEEAGELNLPAMDTGD